MPKSKAAPKPVKTQIDIVKARGALNAARKAFDVIDRRRTKALARLNAAQETVDKAVASIKKNAPAGSKWDVTVFCSIPIFTSR
jgi:hypothetical protein